MQGDNEGFEPRIHGDREPQPTEDLIHFQKPRATSLTAVAIFPALPISLPTIGPPGKSFFISFQQPLGFENPCVFF